MLFRTVRYGIQESLRNSKAEKWYGDVDEFPQLTRIITNQKRRLLKTKDKIICHLFYLSIFPYYLWIILKNIWAHFLKNKTKWKHNSNIFKSVRGVKWISFSLIAHQMANEIGRILIWKELNCDKIWSIIQI